MSNETRNIVNEVLSDNDFFQSIEKYLQGSAGNRQMDQALVAEAIFKQKPDLRESLNHKALWGYVSRALKSFGYDMKAGRARLISN